jgi:hypothetical protein
MTKLAHHRNRMPRSLHIVGIHSITQEAVAQGGFADIFRATWGHRLVAIKRLRVFDDPHTRANVKRVSAGPYCWASGGTTNSCAAVHTRGACLGDTQTSQYSPVPWHRRHNFRVYRHDLPRLAMDVSRHRVELCQSTPSFVEKCPSSGTSAKHPRPLSFIRAKAARGYSWLGISTQEQSCPWRYTRSACAAIRSRLLPATR